MDRTWAARVAAGCAAGSVAAAVWVVAPAASATPLPEPRLASSFSFGAVGDHGGGANTRAVLRAVGAHNPDFFMSLGDLSYDTLEPGPWCQLVKDSLNAGAGAPVGDPYGETYPFEIIRGNHESAEIDEFTAPSCLPDRLSTTPSPDGGYGREYYFDYPADAPLARVITASPGLGYSYAVGSPHRQWLGETIDAARAAGIKWVIVAEHLNYISAGTKGNETGSDFFNFVVSKNVDLLLQGHDHTYQRTHQLAHSAGCPSVPTGTVLASCIANDGSSGVYPAGEGMVTVINGVGGVSNYTVDPADPEAGYFAKVKGGNDGTFFGFTEFTVDENSLSGSFVSAAGIPFSDTFTVGEADPPSGVTYTESWTGANGAAWPAAWTTNSANGSATIASNTGRMAFTDTTGAYARAVLTGVPPTTDTEVLTSYQWSSNTAQAVLNVYLRGSGGWQNPNRPRTGYGLNLVSTTGTITIQRNVNGTLTNLRTVAGGQAVTTARQWLRFRVDGQDVMFRTWRDGTTEPSTWTSTLSDSSIPGAGQLYLTHLRNSTNNAAKNLTLDDLVLTELLAVDTTPPSAPTGLGATSDDSGTQVDLAWTAATDDVGVVGYRVVRDGVVLPATVGSTSYQDTGLTPGQTYVYTVRAYDAAGNTGPDSDPVSITTADPPPSGVLHTETWTGANGAVWPAAWTTNSANGSATIASNTGRMAFTDTTGAYARAVLTGVPPTTDTEVLTSYQWSSNTAQAVLNVYLRGSGGWQNPNRPRTGYGLNLVSTTGTITIQRNVNGTLTNLRTVAGGQAVTTARQWLRFRVDGQDVMFRTWRDGTTEPSTWTSTLSDSSIPGAGQLYLTHLRNSTNNAAKNLTLDDLTLSDPSP